MKGLILAATILHLTLAATAQLASIHSTLTTMKFCDTCAPREFKVLVAEYYVGDKLFSDVFTPEGGKVRKATIGSVKINSQPINPQAIARINLYINTLSTDTKSSNQAKLVLGGIAIFGAVMVGKSLIK